ncbi:tetratricopeptide repeat protein [Pseudanabaena yagii]|nr:tetratricopeptide repeat protein [Pseudanabaena yagii]
MNDFDNENNNKPDFAVMNRQEIQELLSLLDLSDGFTVALAECNFWQDGVALVAALNEEIAADPEWAELQIVDWEFNDPELRYLLDELTQRLATLPRQEGKKLILVLRGLENAIGVVGDYPKFLVDLNFVRDAYIKNVPYPVLFVLPDYAITRFAQFAGDFWAWRSGVFKFQTTQEAREFAEAKTINSDRIIGSYIKPEKQERIDLLHRLLMETKPSGSKPESNSNAASQINILIELGIAYRSLSEFNQAIEFHQQALALSRKISDRNGEAASLNSLGLAYNSLGQYQQAIQFFHQSLDISREIGDHNDEAASLNNLGLTYNSLGQYQQAIQFFHQSLDISKEIGDRNCEASSLCNLGDAYNSLGQYQQAIQFFQQSLKIFREIGNLDFEANALVNLGIAYHFLGEYQQAIQIYQQSLKIKKEIGDRNGESNALGNLGLAYDSLGQYRQAIQFYQQQLEICREIDDRNGEANALNNLGIALQALGRRSESIEAFNASRKIFEELGLYHKIQDSGKSFAPLETVAKEPKRFQIKDEPEELPDWYKKSLPAPKPTPRKRPRRKNLFQKIFNWFHRIWTKLWGEARN